MTKKPMRSSVSTLSVLFLLTVSQGLISCGKPDDTIAAGGEVVNSGSKPALVTFISQCPVAAESAPIGRGVVAYDCDGLTLDMVEPPQPLVFKVDCVKKTLTLRASDAMKHDSTWNIMPDGSFTIQGIEFDSVKFKADGSSNTNCTAYTVLDLSGRAHCNEADPKNIDKVNLDVITNWNVGRISKSTCRLAKSCYLASTAHIKQCQGQVQ